MANHLTRRSFMQAASIATVAIPAGTLAFSAAPGDDPLLGLLLRRRAILADLNRSKSDIADDDPRVIELDAVEFAMIGLPALTTSTALMAMEDVIKDLPDLAAGDVEISLLGAAFDYFRSLSA